MANRALRLSPALAIAASLIVLAGCSSSPTVCNLAPAAGNSCGCGVFNSSECPAPQFLVASGTDGNIYVFPLSGGSLGTPTKVSGPSMSLGMGLLNNSLVYASSFTTTGSGAVYGWSLDFGAGILAPISGSPYSTGPLSVTAGVATANTPQAVYVADAGKIDAFKVGGTGGLTPVSGSPFTSGTNLFITVDPQSRFLFASEVDPPGSVGAFTVDASSGALTQIAGSPFPVVPPQVTSSQPGQIVVDSSGKFVYVTLISNAQIVGFAIDQSSGALTLVPGSPFTADVIPAALATTGNFLYVSANTHLLGYSIDPTSGSLTALASSPPSVRATAITADPFGAHLFASTSTGMMVFSIDATTGALTQIGSTVPAVGASVLAFVP